MGKRIGLFSQGNAEGEVINGLKNNLMGLPLFLLLKKLQRVKRTFLMASHTPTKRWKKGFPPNARLFMVTVVHGRRMLIEDLLEG